MDERAKQTARLNISLLSDYIVSLEQRVESLEEKNRDLQELVRKYNTRLAQVDPRDIRIC